MCRDRHTDDARAQQGGMQRVLGRLGFMAAIAACAAALMTPIAHASTVTVGSVLPPGSVATELKTVQTLFNTALPETGANLTSPVDGAIVRWRMQDATGGPFSLRVLRPNGSGAYTAVGTSNPVMPSGSGVQIFTANLPIKAGDLIGVDPANGTDKIGIAEVAGASYGFFFPPPFDASTVAPSGTEAGKEIALSAEVQPTPAITAVAPNFGPVTGGTTVKITGTNFNAASAVKFGAVPATGFTVDSETQITATAPPSATVDSVDLSVTTLAGTSPETKADLFFYEGCVVPKLKGKKVRPARRALGRADCKLGTVRKVKRPKNKRGKVVAQNQKPGKVLAPGSKVNLTVGK
jgi:IPT/TIG domain-containing protein/PASTA domain-containing protein